MSKKKLDKRHKVLSPKYPIGTLLEGAHNFYYGIVINISLINYKVNWFISETPGNLIFTEDELNFYIKRKIYKLLFKPQRT